MILQFMASRRNDFVAGKALRLTRHALSRPGADYGISLA